MSPTGLHDPADLEPPLGQQGPDLRDGDALEVRAGLVSLERLLALVPLVQHERVRVLRPAQRHEIPAARLGPGGSGVPGEQRGDLVAPARHRLVVPDQRDLFHGGAQPSVKGSRKPPSASSGRPPAVTVAPSPAAPSRNDSTLRYCGSVATGPISVSAAFGSPRRIDRARSAILSTRASCTARDTSSRDPAMQVWPVAANTPASTPLQAASRSASSKTRCA